MKLIGRGNGGSYLCEISREELGALMPSEWGYDPEDIRGDIDVLQRLAPTVAFEKDKSAIPHMVAHIRDAADQLEKAFKL